MPPTDVNQALNFRGEGGSGRGEGRGGVMVDVNREVGVGGLGRGGRVWGGGRVGGVRLDVNEELKFLGKFTKKNRGGGREGGRSGRGVGLVGGGSGWM